MLKDKSGIHFGVTIILIKACRTDCEQKFQIEESSHLPTYLAVCNAV